MRLTGLVSRYALTAVLLAAGAEVGAAATATADNKSPRIRLKPATKELLLAMEGATQAAPYQIIDRTADPVKELNKHKAIYFDDSTKNGNAVMAILSPAGQELVKKYKETTPANPRGPLPKPEDFQLEDDVPVPTANRQSIARQIYPFDSMKVGQSFFIAPTETSPEPAKSKQSSVNAQNRKSAAAFDERKAAGGVPDGEVAPKWRIAEDTKDGVKGARVWRIQ